MKTRQEQIADLERFILSLRPGVTVSERKAIATKVRSFLAEAEKRMRAESDADTKRLDWLADHVSSIKGAEKHPWRWRILFYSNSAIRDPKHIRKAIDSARKEEP